MVGIVIVAHSAALAAGVKELALQMVRGEVAIAIAAGIDDAENPFGTDAMQVYQAIESVYNEDGVVVLMDLGSAVMSAEMALELLPEERRSKVRLCEAPLVEGAIAAVVQAAAGSDIERVLAEARGSLSVKAAQLSNSILLSPHVSSEENKAGSDKKSRAKEIYITVRNQWGLHARPAAKFVTTAAQFQSRISVRNITRNSGAANAKSINQLATLGVRFGHQIAIASEGIDAIEAMAALQQLIEGNFGETSQAAREAFTPNPQSPIPNPQSPITHYQLPITNPPLPIPKILSGIPIAGGIAIGPAILYSPEVPDVVEQLLDNPHTAWEQLQQAIATAREEIKLLRLDAASQMGEDEAAIFDAHLLYLEDPAIIDKARQIIFDQCWSAATAWKTVLDETIATYEALEDPYLKARAADVKDVGQRVLRSLFGVSLSRLNLKEPAIVITTDLSPSYTVELDPTKVLGICTVLGSANSHSAIIARSLGIPAVMGVGAELLRLENGTTIALDGDTGQIWVKPDEDILKELQSRKKSQLAVKQGWRDSAKKPAISRDRQRVTVMANIGNIADAKLALEMGAEGAGLLRSEFLYLQRESAPTEEEQVQIYAAIADILAPHPLIIRTLDIGGDKTLPYLNLPPETNPFLGWRGIRFLLDSPDLFLPQLRAILRASHQRKIKVMFPMVASLSEVRAAKKMLATARSQLSQAGIPFNNTIEVGIMVEIPAAVAIADRLAAEVNFFSIGTNDLSQYVMACDRNHPKVAQLADAFEPAVLRTIEQTVKAADSAGIWVGLCGELASSPLAIPILLGLGVDELSVNPASIPAVKAAISQLTMAEAQTIARAVLQLDSAAAVREYVRSLVK